jgi:hypothetical protein
MANTALNNRARLMGNAPVRGFPRVAEEGQPDNRPNGDSVSYDFQPCIDSFRP